MKTYLQSHRVQALMALMLCLLVIALQMRKEPPDFRIGDSYTYMSVAKNLVDKGVFTDGSFSKQAPVQGEHGEGMFFAPLYPVLIAGVMALDPVFYDNVSCHMTDERPENCPDDMGLFRYVQGLLAVLSAWLVWLSGWLMTRKYGIAWLAMGLGVVAEAYAYYTAQIMTETLVFPLFTASSLAFAYAWRDGRFRYWLLAGALFGLLALTRPAFVYLFYVCSFISLVRGLYERQALALVFLLLGYLLTAGPWMLRNEVYLGSFGISKGYASFILVQRVAYNRMSWEEWGASFIYGLPDFGDSLAEDIFEPASYERFDYDHPEGFYEIGNSSLRKETIEKAGGLEHHLSYLLKQEVIGNPFKHVMVTLSLAWRGMWVSKYWGFVTIPIFIGVFIVSLQQRRWGYVLFSLAPWFMLGFHAFTSVNVVRYNLILIPCLAIAGAILLTGIICSITNRVKKLQPAPV